MAKVNSFLGNRLRSATETLSKMAHLADMSSKGNLSSFSGVFGKAALSARETEAIEEILTTYSGDKKEAKEDKELLLSITSEVKAINSQAIILHGERIKKVQELLATYEEGAFSAWLLAAYGNRQTPYNFLQYYEFHAALPKLLHEKLDEMPRQAVYALASRDGAFEKKEEIVRNYQGEPKREILEIIRSNFPLKSEDKRAKDPVQSFISILSLLEVQMKKKNFHLKESQKESIKKTLTAMLFSVEKR